jgi:hypothetical protein
MTGFLLLEADTPNSISPQSIFPSNTPKQPLAALHKNTNPIWYRVADLRKVVFFCSISFLGQIAQGYKVSLVGSFLAMDSCVSWRNWVIKIIYLVIT